MFMSGNRDGRRMRWRQSKSALDYPSKEGLEANKGFKFIQLLVQKCTVGMRNDQMLKVTALKFKS